MNLAFQKIELTKKLLETNDPEIISHLEAVFSTQSDQWWEQLPSDIQDSILKGLQQSVSKETIAHEDAMKPYLKWLKK